MPEVSSWGCSTVCCGLTLANAFASLAKETSPPLLLLRKSQGKHTVCYIVISAGVFSWKFACACRGYGSIVAQLRSMRESHLRDGGHRHSEPHVVL